MACLITGFRARFECYSCSHCWCRLGDLGKLFSALPVPITLDGACCLVVHQVYSTVLNLRAALGRNAALLHLPYSLFPYCIFCSFPALPLSHIWLRKRLTVSLQSHMRGGFTLLTTCHFRLLAPFHCSPTSEQKDREVALCISGQLTKQSVIQS